MQFVAFWNLYGLLFFIKFLLDYPFVPMQKKSTTVNAYSPVHTTNKYLEKKKEAFEVLNFHLRMFAVKIY